VLVAPLVLALGAVLGGRLVTGAAALWEHALELALALLAAALVAGFAVARRGRLR
jgi:hypothetical protein